ncbi:galactose-3-O-sulfotransferase 2-like isoform X1 [Branchiostoma floridae x Branchiostoma belcheri]
MCYLQPKTWMFTILTMVILAFFGLGHISTRVLKDILQPPQPAKMQNSISAGAQQENIDETEKATDTCSPKWKYVFVALHKVGSSTTINIFNRYALTHELSMLLPASGNIISWGASPTEEDYIHTPDEQYDVLTNHYQYNKTWIRSKFPANTAYISIIREPSKKLRSAMNYYNIETLLKMRSTNPMKTFLEDAWKFKNLSEAYFPHRNLIYDPTRNFMSFDLGYPAEAAEDMERARRYIKEADFTLIMLLDYLDESLVLLKRLMCWDLQDVLVLTKNNRTYPFKICDPNEVELANLRRWKAVDYLLYDTFNRSLWRQIAEQGPDFFEELSIFKDMSKHVHAYCSTGHKPETYLTVEASKWIPQFHVDDKFCGLLRLTVMAFLQRQRPNAIGRALMSTKMNLMAIAKGHRTVKYLPDRKYHNITKA